MAALTDLQHALAVLLALLVALVLVVSAWLVYRTAFKDGSVLTDDLQHLSAVVNRYAAIQRAHEDRAAVLRRQLVTMQRRSGDRRLPNQPGDSP